MRKMILALTLTLLALLGGAPNAHAEGRRNNDGPATASAPAPAAAPAGGVVNVNEATPDQLGLLPGVGPSRANAIVAYRKTHPFKRVEELTRIKGIGKKTFARLKPLIALSGPTTLSERPQRR